MPKNATHSVARECPHEPNTKTRKARPRLAFRCSRHGAAGLVGPALDNGGAMEPQQGRTLHIPGAPRTLRSHLADGPQFAAERAARSWPDRTFAGGLPRHRYRTGTLCPSRSPRHMGEEVGSEVTGVTHAISAKPVAIAVHLIRAPLSRATENHT